jgi:UDP-N-acetylglucosamine 4,6-dehydratase
MEEQMPFSGKTLLVTGGTGSFGEAVVDRFLGTDIGEIRVFSRDEKKQDDMRREYRSPKLTFRLGDVRDRASLDGAMRGIDFVFCAAALKQIPSCEFNPIEAVRTNVLGTENTIESAIANRASRLVVLSTDKAVYPINAMGMSKALMEKAMIARSRDMAKGETLLCGTRHGNVLGSRGSALPLFIKQIKEGKQITITDPNMTRFVMSAPQAVDLVILAMESAEAGDIFIPKAPTASIGEIAEVAIEIFGGTKGIQAIGSRHGEKPWETLISREEAARAIDLGGYYRIPADTRSLNYDLGSKEDGPAATADGAYESRSAPRLSRDELRRLILSLAVVQEELGEHA